MLKQGRLVALEKTADLLQRFSHQTLSFRLAAGDLPAALAARAVPTGQRWRVTLRDAADMEAVLRLGREAGCRLEDIELHQADLEDVFLALTGDAPQPPQLAPEVPA
jgi:ABC-2 type transport system ATP-binding protein